LAVAIARIVASRRIADRLAPVGVAAAWGAPGAGIEQAPNPAEGVNAEVALATTAATLAATLAIAARAAIVIAVDPLADRAARRAARRTVAVARAAALIAAAASASAVLQKSAATGRQQNSTAQGRQPHRSTHWSYSFFCRLSDERRRLPIVIGRIFRKIELTATDGNFGTVAPAFQTWRQEDNLPIGGTV
jgi:hypothetical protein